MEDDMVEIVSELGRNIEDVGRMLAGRGRKIKRPSIDDLLNARDVLKLNHSTLDILINIEKGRIVDS